MKVLAPSNVNYIDLNQGTGEPPKLVVVFTWKFDPKSAPYTLKTTVDAVNFSVQQTLTSGSYSQTVDPVTGPWPMVTY